mgnify:CR=1 FL=1
MESKFVYRLFLLWVVLIAGLSAFSGVNRGEKVRLLVVQSASMEPAIKKGSIVMVKKRSQYQKGEVITYQDKRDPRITTTHRIVMVKEKEFITKGDANNAVDSPVSAGQVLGKVVWSIPYLGYPVAFAKTQIGLILLVIIPATIIIYSEVLNIKNEIKRRWSKD